MLGCGTGGGGGFANWCGTEGKVDLHLNCLSYDVVRFALGLLDFEKKCDFYFKMSFLHMQWQKKIFCVGNVSKFCFVS